jgi:hypothetical protein
MSAFFSVVLPCDGLIPRPSSLTKSLKVFIVSQVNSESELASGLISDRNSNIYIMCAVVTF